MTGETIRIGRGMAALEAAIGWGLRAGLVPGLKWLLALAALTLPLMPVVRTAWVGFLLVIAILVWVRWRGERLADFGLKWPASWWRAILIALGLMIACIASSALLDPLIEGLFGPDRAAETFANVEGNLGLYLFTLPCIWLFAAFGEEAFYRGFLMTRLHQAFGDGRWAWPAAVVGQAILFGLGHAYQGVSGMIGVAIYGLFYGVAVRLSRGSLVPAIIGHGLLDTLGFTLLYLGAL